MNSVNKYRKKNYDTIQLLLPKGEKDKLKEFLSSNNDGESMNSFIQRAIREQMIRETVDRLVSPDGDGKNR